MIAMQINSVTTKTTIAVGHTSVTGIESKVDEWVYGSEWLTKWTNITSDNTVE
jgi:hypothetical protein